MPERKREQQEIDGQLVDISTSDCDPHPVVPRGISRGEYLCDRCQLKSVARMADHRQAHQTSTTNFLVYLIISAPTLQISAS